MNKKQNRLYISFPAFPENERVARTIVAAFLAGMNPTVEEMDDVKTAVSEAVTNSIIHAYEKEKRMDCHIEMLCERDGDIISIRISDTGVGIKDVKKAMEPLYTTRSQEERSGMGFSFMEAFMDSLVVESQEGKGTIVTMKKKIGSFSGRHEEISCPKQAAGK